MGADLSKATPRPTEEIDLMEAVKAKLARSAAEIQTERDALLSQLRRAQDALVDKADAANALLAQVARLEAALRPFAALPLHGDYGGPQVAVQVTYEDGSSRHIGHEALAAAREALETP